MDPVITVQGLSKRYGSVTAVADVSLDVGRGEIFGILGPNGAGKTTTVEMIQGLRRPDAGSVRLLGLDPQRDTREVRERVGTQLQSAVLPDELKVWEALDLYASFYRAPHDPGQLLATWGLAEKRDATFGTLSGGQRQRLFIALALIGDPEVVFLDELTTGLDPHARRATWELVRAIRASGVTVVLVTHFMDEAETLCDRIAIIDDGRVVALDTPAALTRHARQAQRVLFTAPPEFVADWLATVDGVDDIAVRGDEVIVTGTGPLLARVATCLATHDASPDDLRTERATLEDAFLGLTGHSVSL